MGLERERGKKTTCRLNSDVFRALAVRVVSQSWYVRVIHVGHRGKRVVEKKDVKIVTGL